MSFCGTTGSPSCARQLYLTVLYSGNVYFVTIAIATDKQANHNFSNFSLTTVKFTDFFQIFQAVGHPVVCIH